MGRSEAAMEVIRLTRRADSVQHALQDVLEQLDYTGRQDPEYPALRARWAEMQATISACEEAARDLEDEHEFSEEEMEWARYEDWKHRGAA